MLLDGHHLVADALAAGVPIAAAAIGSRARAHPESAGLLARLERSGADVYEASDAVLDAASPVRTPTGLVAIGRLSPAGLSDVWQPAPALVVGVAGVQDPGNVGAIVRAADAAGATGMLVARGSADPFGWKALRASMGSAFRVPIVTNADLDAACREARARGVGIAATSPSGGRDLYEADLRSPLLLLVGAEGPGLGDDLLAAGLRVRIPMRAPCESLNVAMAAGIILFEVRRQRSQNGRS